MAYQYRGDKRMTASELLAMSQARETAVKPTHRLENAEHLLRAGCPVEDALKRAGYQTLSAFKRAAQRNGRHDLIRHISERLVA